MKNILIIFCVITITALFSGCLDSYETDECDYSDCNTLYPSEGVMTVKVSDNPDGGGVPIAIYEGFFDNGILIYRDTIQNRYEEDYYLTPEMYYTVVAEYTRYGKTIHVVDGGRILVQSNKICDSVCYSVRDLTVNVKLKY